MTITVRTATETDIASVDALLVRSYPQQLKAEYAPAMLAQALPIIACAQPELITCGTYYVAEEEGVIHGAGGWTATAPGTGALSRGIGHIRHVATDVDATRRGIGRILMEHILRQCRAQGLQRLLCLSTLTAIPFYAAMGFTPGKTVLVPLGSRVEFPAMEMERAL